MNLSDLSIAEAGRRFRDGSLSPVALTEHCLRRIQNEDHDLRSFNTVTAEMAVKAAERAAAELQSGKDRGPLHGIPYAAKDIIDVAGVLTSCQSRLLRDNIPGSDAEVISRLKGAGAVLVGKTTTYEFATGGPATDALFPPARNPWDSDRVPGGSSSGSAAAIATGYVRCALGTDTGGSIRGPASLCGTVGMKPTFGRVSRRGVYPLAYSLDNCGPMAWTVEDAAILLSAIAGPDGNDPSSAAEPTRDYVAAARATSATLSIALGMNWLHGADSELAAKLEEAADTLGRMGARVDRIDLPHWNEFVPASRLILLAECFAVHRRNLIEKGDLYGRRSRSRLISGCFVEAADYLDAQRVRRHLMRRMNDEIFASYDVIIVPTTMSPAMRFEELSSDPTHIPDVTTVPFSLTGHPAMSVCCGFTASGLPLGMQLVARYFREDQLLQAGAAYETATHWSSRRPDLRRQAA